GADKALTTVPTLCRTEVRALSAPASVRVPELVRPPAPRMSPEVQVEDPDAVTAPFVTMVALTSEKPPRSSEGAATVSDPAVSASGDALTTLFAVWSARMVTVGIAGVRSMETSSDAPGTRALPWASSQFVGSSQKPLESVFQRMAGVAASGPAPGAPPATPAPPTA